MTRPSESVSGGKNSYPETRYGASLKQFLSPILDLTPWTLVVNVQTDLSHGTTQKCIIQIKATEKCLAHKFIIAIARIVNDSNRKGWKIRPVVRDLLDKTGIDLSGGAGIQELARFQEHFREYKIMLYQGLSCDNIMFEGRVESTKRLNLLYDDVQKHCHVITNLNGDMARR